MEQAKAITIGGHQISLNSGPKASTIQFHTHASSIASVGTDNGVEIYSIEKSASVISLVSKGASKQHAWSPLSGSQLVSHSAANVVSIYDPRGSADAQLDITTSFQSNRPSYSAFLDDATLIATGTTSTTRTRTLRLFDIRSPATPKLTVPFDSSSSPSLSLVPFVDTARRLVYIAQTHSSSLYAFDLNESNPVPITLHLPSTIVAASLLPSQKADVMRAEINRVFVLTSRDEIVPVSVRIERKVNFILHGAGANV